MKNGADQILSVFREAEKPGIELEPSELLAGVLLHSDPIRAISDIDQGNIFFDAMRHQFGFMQHTRATGKPLSAEDLGQWAALVRWLVRELREWRTQNDPRCHKLKALFVAVAYCDPGDSFWTEFPPGLEENHDLVTSLQKVVATSSYNITTRGVRPLPIWEKEALESFKQADVEGHWFAISEQWDAFENVFIPNTFLVQTVRCIHRFGFERLVQALNGIRQTPIAMLVADALSVDQRLGLGIASDNPYLQFASVYGAISDWPRTKRLSDSEQDSLAQLLLKVASDGPRWVKWMQVFNRYPLRYPAMQVALGHALADAPDAAIQAYVEAVSLSSSFQYDDSRRAVAECLRVFRTRASSERCKLMWKTAFDRWTQWQFDIANRDAHLFEIGGSELDYAVVAYAVECMNEAERDAVLTAIHGELSLLHNTWHASHTDCISKWNRLLSKFQPYAHAAQVILSAEDWLMEGKRYCPTDLNDQDYVKMMYRIG